MNPFTSDVTILLVPLALAAVTIHAAWIAWRRLMVSRHWLPIDAKIVSLRSGSDLLREVAPLWATSIITLQYRAHLAPFDSRQFLAHRLQAEPGSIIQVRYNPENPAQVLIDESASMVIAALLREAIFAFLAALAVAAALTALFNMGSTRIGRPY